MYTQKYMYVCICERTSVLTHINAFPVPDSIDAAYSVLDGGADDRRLTPAPVIGPSPSRTQGMAIFNIR